MRMHSAISIASAAGLGACLVSIIWMVFAPTGGSLSDHVRNTYRRPTEIPYPANNPYSLSKHKLGEKLFFDPILSGSQSRSCASCHEPRLSWGDGRALAIGENQTVLTLRSPTLLNVAWVPRPGWDGHFRDIEAVAFGPILSSSNMNNTESDVLARLSADPRYVEAFLAAFGDGEITRRRIELALATFERSIVSGEAPFDRYINGDETAVGDTAKRGFATFAGKAHCTGCHNGWAFTDSSFHDIGTAHGSDLGRGRLFPSSKKLQYAFKTPTLRDVIRRGPYMHDGSVATLSEVIDLYNRGGVARESRSALIFPLHLSEDEKADLIAFLETLTSTEQPAHWPTVSLNK
jgi:cytochrome c peroxidase